MDFGDYNVSVGFPWWLSGKESACQCSSIPESEISPREGNDNPLQYSFLGNPMDRGAWQATVPRVTKSQTWLSDRLFHFTQLNRLLYGWNIVIQLYVNFKKSMITLSRSAMSNSLRPHGLQSFRLLHPWDSPGKNTGVGCHALLQGIFPTQGSNPGLPHCRWILYHLSHKSKNELLSFFIL